MVKSFQLALTGAARRVSDVYGGTPGIAAADVDIPYREIIFQSETAAVQLGQDNTVSATNYGNSIATGLVLIAAPSAPGAPLKLSDFWAFGTATLHILAFPL